MKVTCQISGKEFELSEEELKLRREKFGMDDLPRIAPEYRLRQLGAFWQHWNLYKRKCDKSGKNIISVFRPDCEYPVWHKDEWVKHADPPAAEIDFQEKVFPQVWKFFQESPIPHITGSANENCEYTDDSWFSRNCYLCHSQAHCEDLAYCYRAIKSRDSQYCVFSFNLELCVDVINSDGLFNSVYCLNCRNCQDSAFLYDCRNCSDCMFSSNLRNKKYCFFNEQLSKEEYEERKSEWNLFSRKVYEEAKGKFLEMMTKEAWHRTLSNDLCENTSGNYNARCKDAENCYFCQENEQCVNCFRNYIGKTSLDFHGQTSEMCFYTILAQDECYDIRFCSQVVHSQYLQYCAFCLNCQNCFACCGLVGKSFCIFNKQYSKEEFYQLRDKLIAHMKSTGEYGQFFPGYMSPVPYDETWSSFYFPLEKEEQEDLGFKNMPPYEKKLDLHRNPDEIPDSARDFSEDDLDKIYWDEVYDRPFRIRKDDLQFSEKLGVPLPYTYYIRRLQENFRMVPFDGTLRKSKCGKCGKEILTSWPAEFDGRILCEEDYLEVVQ